MKIRIHENKRFHYQLNCKSDLINVINHEQLRKRHLPLFQFLISILLLLQIHSLSNAQSLNDPFSYAIFGDSGKMKIDKNVTVTGNIFQHGDVEIKKDTSVTNGLLYATGNVIIEQGAEVTQGNLPDPLPQFPQFSTSYYDNLITIAHGQPHNDKIVSSLTLNGDTLYINGKLILENGGTISGPGIIVTTDVTTINVDSSIGTGITIICAEKLEIKKNTSIGQATLFSNKEILIEENSNITANILSLKDITIKEAVIFNGIIFTPDKLLIKENSTINGIIMAGNDIEIKKDTNITYNQTVTSSCIPGLNETPYYEDTDSDGYGNPTVIIKACEQPTGYVTNNSDCNDNDTNEHPGQTWHKDEDGDGYSDGVTDTISCTRPTGYKTLTELTSSSTDCDDTNVTVNPGATEIPDNNIDDDCNPDTPDNSGSGIVLPEGTYGKIYENLIPADATIEEYDSKRFSLITGTVNNNSQNPIQGVAVSIYDHPEYGTVHTDSQGVFSIPVEGGGVLTIIYEQSGFITSHRQVDVGWNDIAVAETITLITEDTVSTTLTFDGDPATIITHKSTTISDEFGSRAATMVFSGDNRAFSIDENGNETELSTITTRATEFTTIESMPAKLPPNSAYTYCTELSVDDADKVRFEKPVPVFVNNFLGFDVGEAVPVGYYNREGTECSPPAWA